MFASLSAARKISSVHTDLLGCRNEMSNTIEIEAEPQTMALERRQPQELAPTGLFGAVEPAQVVTKAAAVATALRDVIEKQGLISSISGKKYPKCEAWTLLGTMLGVFPVLVWTKPVEGGWEARVEARTKDGSIVGAAEAQCLKSENNWKNRDDFALRSMAQTRATAKCLRMPLGFVMTLAGYEVTPAEEMATDHPQQRSNRPQERKPPVQTPPPASKPQQPPTAVQGARQKPLCGTEKTRDWMIRQLDGAEDIATEYFQALENPAVLFPAESLKDLPLEWVAMNPAEIKLLQKQLSAFASGDPPVHPYPPHPLPEEEKKRRAAKKTAEAPKPLPQDDPNSPNAPWRSFPMPFGNDAGTQLAKMDKKVLFGWWANFKVAETFTGSDGQEKRKRPETMAKDRKLRAMLDEAGKHYEFDKPRSGPSEVTDRESGPSEPQDGPEDDIPF